MWTALIEEGVYVNMVPPQATPGLHLLRCSLCAEHSEKLK